VYYFPIPHALPLLSSLIVTLWSFFLFFRLHDFLPTLDFLSPFALFGTYPFKRTSPYPVHACSSSLSPNNHKVFFSPQPCIFAETVPPVHSVNPFHLRIIGVVGLLLGFSDPLGLSILRYLFAF